MRILCWGTYDVGKPRARLLLKGLRENGATVLECHADIWRGVTDKSQVRGVRRQSGILLRWLLSYPRLAWQLARAPRPDVILIGFPGILDMLVAAPIARLRGIPLVWDMFMSLYDTIVEDRRLLGRRGIAARLLHALEGFALRRADLVFLDTQAHARRIEAHFQLAPGSVGAVWVGAETEHFHADTVHEATSPALDRSPLRVLFYGQFIPLHGIETIVRAARLTADEPIEWQLIGKGQDAGRIRALLAEQPLSKVHWEEWVDYAQLPQRIADADVCLGIFGTSGKAASVIPNKVFQILAMGRPLITRDSSAIREILEDAPPCVTLIPAADPAALAAAVRNFAREQRPVKTCHALLQSQLDAKAVGQQCLVLLKTNLTMKHTRMENSTLLGPAAPEYGWVPAPRYLLRRDRVMHALKDIQPCRMLEIGCGAGMLLQELAARKFECYALETSDDARALGVKLAAEANTRIEFHATPEEGWRDSFSLLMAFEVLEHIEDDASAVALWHTWLAPGAKLILSVPAHQKRWNARDVWAGHVRRYERQELVGVVESAGFVVESVDCYGFPLANILEKAGERRYKKHRRVQVDQNAQVRDANTAQSGIDRSADAKWYPFLRSPLGRIAIAAAMLIQRPFRHTERGNGYVLVARKA